MKIQTIFRMLSLSLLFVLLGSVAMAQTKDEKKAKDAEMKAKQEQIEIQRKQMKEQQLKTIELEHFYADQAREASRARSSTRVYSRSSGFDEPSYFIYSGSQENQSQLTIRNSFDGETDSSEGEFDVNESTTHIRCTINGKAKSGKITVKILYPGGKVFKDLSITSSAQISFSQSLTIQEEEKNKYIGAWKYKVTADKAEGSYTLSFMTH
ncbi:MAG: hypothetical protein GQ579_06815 [Bacteroidales bacterium]|nr:hypothetical protein [Bacteroidales bacterium]